MYKCQEIENIRQYTLLEKKAYAILELDYVVHKETEKETNPQEEKQGW